MAEKPILFKPELVRGILAAAGLLDAPPKLQTRRIVTEIEDHDRARLQMFDPVHGVATFVDSIPDDTVAVDIPCRYGAEGDRLWVRETWRPMVVNANIRGAAFPTVQFRADFGVLSYGRVPEHDKRFDGWSKWPRSETGNARSLSWRPSIFLPRWASRITLTLAEVRVERVQDCTQRDAEAEGFVADSSDFPLDQFRRAWNRINAKRATWDDNPWVWVLRWKRNGIEVRQ